MNTRRTLLKTAAALAAISLSLPSVSHADEPIPVVATFSILGDMVQSIGGKHVSVTTLVGADGDTHVYQPTPADARAVNQAKVLVVNGLEFEGWLHRLVEASEFKGERVVATSGIEPIPFEEKHGDDHHDEHGDKHGKDEHHDDHKENHAKDEHHDKHDEKHAKDEHHDEHKENHAKDEHHDEHEGDHAKKGHHDHHGHDHGAFDPHAWQSLKHAIKYIDNITAALAKADPDNAATYYQNRAAYVVKVEALDAEIRDLVARLPANRRTVVTSHDAFQYFGRDYGLTFLAPQGLSTESEASAQDMAKLIRHIREHGISAVFIENITDARLLKQIANETGARIGGTLYPGALSGPKGPAPTYLDMMRHNAATLVSALSS